MDLDKTLEKGGGVENRDFTQCWPDAPSPLCSFELISRYIFFWIGSGVPVSDETAPTSHIR